MFLNFNNIAGILQHKKHATQLFYLLLFIVCGFFLFYFLGFMLVLVFTSFTLSNLFSSLADFSNKETIVAYKILQICNQLGMLVIPTLLWAKLVNNANQEMLGIKIMPSIKNIVIIILFSVLIIPGINYLGELNNEINLPLFLSDLENWMRNAEEKAAVITKAFLAMPTFLDFVINVIMIAFLAALGEELLFRGAFQNLFYKWLQNHHIAIWISAILFSAIHVQFYGFIPRMLLGVCYGYIYYHSKNIWIPILAHFTNNFVAVLSSYLISNNIINITENTANTYVSNIFTIAITFIISVLIYYFFYSEKKYNL